MTCTLIVFTVSTHKYTNTYIHKNIYNNPTINTNGHTRDQSSMASMSKSSFASGPNKLCGLE